jgi:CheY-like chemotaxis protein
MMGEVVTAMLEHLGYQTVTTTSGPETLHQAARLQPAAILLDLLMPGMDGWETAAALKARPDTRDIPIIILSGLSPQEEGGFPAGVTEWLCKPVEEATLAHALQRAVNGQASTACVLVAEDDLDLAKVLIVTLQRHGIESFHARTGREAIQLSQRLSPDLLILDPIMPDGDGFSVVKWLRQQNRLCQMPLVVYSAKDLDADERARLTLGPTRFFTKGRIKPEEFEQRVIGWLNDITAQRGEGQHNGTQADFGH